MMQRGTDICVQPLTSARIWIGFFVNSSSKKLQVANVTDSRCLAADLVTLMNHHPLLKPRGLT